MVSEKVVRDRIRRIYGKENISELLNIHNMIGLRIPRKGKMTDETYKIRLIENLVEWRVNCIWSDENYKRRLK